MIKLLIWVAKMDKNITYKISVIEQALKLLENIEIKGAENAKRIVAIEAILQNPIKIENSEVEHGEIHTSKSD